MTNTTVFQSSGLLLALCLLCANSIASDRVSWSLENDASLVDEAKALLAQGDLPQERRVVQLRYRRHIEIRHDGVDETIEHIYFYPDVESVQNDGSDSIVWDKYGQKLTVLAAAVVASDGTVHRFDPETSQVLTDSSTSVFTGQNRVVLQLPGLDAGALSVLAYRRSLSDAQNFMANGYAQTSITSLYREFRFSWEGARPLWRADNEAFECTEDVSSVTCVSRLSEPVLEDDDVFYADVMPKLAVAANKSWDDVIVQIDGFMQRAMRDRSALDPYVAEFKAAENPIASVLDLVSKKIRYVSFSEAQHAYLPHEVGDTLNRRYGDCKDKSAVMLALLTELGYEAYAVLVATDMQDPASLAVPSRGHFDHMVVCAKLEDGERCFDPTDVHAGAGSTPSGIQGKVRLNILPGSVPQKLPRDEYVWTFHVDNDLEFQKDGSQTEQLERTYQSAYATWFRGKLAAENEDDQNAWLLEMHESVVDSVQEPEFEVHGLDDTGVDLKIASRGTYANLAEPGKNLNYADGAFWIQNEIRRYEITNEHYGVEISGANYSSVYRFDLQELWKLRDVGPEVSFNTEFGSFRREYVRDADQLMVKTELRIPSQRVEPSSFKDFNRFIKLADNATNIAFWGKPAKK